MTGAAPHLEAFLAAAYYFEGITETPPGSNSFGTNAKANEMLNLAGYPGYKGAWCAVFVSACAAKAGIDEILIHKQCGVGGVTSNSVDWFGAKWIPGPYFTGSAVTPQPGDLFTTVGSPASDYSGYAHGGHIGIVLYVDDDGMHTMEGNGSNNDSAQHVRALNNSGINGFVRPDWESLGDNVAAYLNGGTSVGPLYQNRNDRHDMTVRQVGYLDSSFLPSNSNSSLAFSVINYTSVLGDLYELFAPMAIAEPKVDTSSLSGNDKIVVDYLIGQGFTASSACGVAGCLYAYSGISSSYTAKTPGGVYTYGIGAWPSAYLAELRSRVGADWNNNLSGQLDFLLYDLSTRYKLVLASIKYKMLDAEFAVQAAQSMMLTYNQLRTSSADIESAKTYAQTLYGKLIITYTRMVGGGAIVAKDVNGNLLQPQFSVTVPSSVSQTGLTMADFTSYSAWYHSWGRGTTQRALADNWAYQGYPCDRGIAKIGGYYCFAVKDKFGKCGDVIAINMKDGTTIPGIIADEKGADATSEWGHVKGGGKVSILEMEMVKTSNGKVQLDTSSTDVDYSVGDWLGKEVASITNYGSYL